MNGEGNQYQEMTSYTKEHIIKQRCFVCMESENENKKALEEPFIRNIPEYSWDF